MAATSTAGNFGGKKTVRIVVAGDQGTGKSSLIISVATESFPEHVQPVVPPSRLPSDFYPDRVPITIIDTSSRSVCDLFDFAFIFLGSFCCVC